MEIDRQDLLNRLQRLSRKDRKRRIFGSAAHNYTLNEPIAPAEIEAFETEHDVSFPDDYRTFITEIGNGGAGPVYGLFPFGQHDDGPWDGGQLVGDLGQPFPHTESWNLEKSFWKNEPNIPEGISPEEEDRLWEEWDKLLFAQYWNPEIMNGAIPICHVGCALRQWLVVNGEQRGYVWDDLRADHGGLKPIVDESGQGITFSAWYMNWLEESEAKLA